jgi:hypothetical protein
VVKIFAECLLKTLGKACCVLIDQNESLAVRASPQFDPLRSRGLNYLTYIPLSLSSPHSLSPHPVCLLFHQPSEAMFMVNTLMQGAHGHGRQAEVGFHAPPCSEGVQPRDRHPGSAGRCRGSTTVSVGLAYISTRT